MHHFLAKIHEKVYDYSLQNKLSVLTPPFHEQNRTEQRGKLGKKKLKPTQTSSTKITESSYAEGQRAKQRRSRSHLREGSLLQMSNPGSTRLIGYAESSCLKGQAVSESNIDSRPSTSCGARRRPLPVSQTPRLPRGPNR